MIYLARFPNYTLVITATRLHNQYVIARAASHFTIKDFKRVKALTCKLRANVLTVVCKRFQQLPTMLRGPAVPSGKDTTHKTL